MSDIISDLYYGELRPNEREYLEGVEAEVLLESFKQDEAWLTEHLEGAAKEHLLELVNCHDELDGLTAYESFRSGFLLGARLIMAVCREGKTHE
jgi:hypothetical protein